MMMQAVHQTNYDGYLVYLHGNNLESLRAVHTVEDGHEIERLFSLNGEAREVVRDNDSVTRILPNEKAISTTKRFMNKQYFSGFFVLDPEEIEKNYQLDLQGTGRIADRATNIISFTPRDSLRYGYRLHLDDHYALPLQWEMFDHDDNLVSSIMFTQISIGTSVKDSGPLLEKGETSVVEEEPTLSNSDYFPEKLAQNWAFSSLPKGFYIKHHRQGIPHHKTRNIEHYIFSDGIASFSVYIEETDKVRLNGLANLGALNAFGVYLNGYQVTAVGEVPPETLAFISLLEKKND
jgi:sigma-E factor negative regulatory protein RseB